MAAAYGLDKFSITATYDSVWRSQIYTVGSKFTIERIRIPLGTALAANQSLVCKIFYDDSVSSKTLTTINTTNFTAGTRKIIFGQQEILSDTITPQNNFFIELQFGGSVSLPVLLPILIEIDVAEDENND